MGEGEAGRGLISDIRFGRRQGGAGGCGWGVRGEEGEGMSDDGDDGDDCGRGRWID